MPPVPPPTSADDTTVFYACQSTSSTGTPGLLGTGLGAVPATASQSCTPAAVVTH